jgi:hypothetical protein
VAVKVIASLRQDGSAEPLVTTTVDFRHENQELMADSVNNLFKDGSEASRRFRA